jgi:hypothetical protein
MTALTNWRIDILLDQMLYDHYRVAYTERRIETLDQYEQRLHENTHLKLQYDECKRSIVVMRARLERLYPRLDQTGLHREADSYFSSTGRTYNYVLIHMLKNTQLSAMPVMGLCKTDALIIVQLRAKFWLPRLLRQFEEWNVTFYAYYDNKYVIGSCGQIRRYRLTHFADKGGKDIHDAVVECYGDLPRVEIRHDELTHTGWDRWNTKTKEFISLDTIDKPYCIAQDKASHVASVTIRRTRPLLEEDRPSDIHSRKRQRLPALSDT